MQLYTLGGRRVFTLAFSFLAALTAISAQPAAKIQPTPATGINLSPAEMQKMLKWRAQVTKSHALGHGPVTPVADPPNGMVVTNVSATALATSLLGPGVTLSGTPTFFGAPEQEGTFTGAPCCLVPFSSGIILSSGRAADAASSFQCTSGCPSTDETSAAGGNGGQGYAPLTALITPSTTNDAAVLQFSFIPTTSTIYFQYIFASAEFQCCVGSFNDPMALFVNGTAPSNNVALLPTTPPVAVTINNVNATTNAQYYNKNNASGDNFTYAGETKLLTATVNVNPGVVNTITLAVADANDHVFDSAVLIKAGSISTTPPTPSGTPAPPSLVLSMIGLAALGVTLALTQRRRPA